MKFCSICGRPQSEHLPADGTPEPDRGRTHGRRGATGRNGGRNVRLPSPARVCPVVPIERDGRTVWMPRRLAELEPADDAG